MNVIEIIGSAHGSTRVLTLPRQQELPPPILRPLHLPQSHLRPLPP